MIDVFSFFLRAGLTITIEPKSDYQAQITIDLSRDGKVLVTGMGNSFKEACEDTVTEIVELWAEAKGGGH